MVLVTVIYMLVVAISIGILGPDLAADKAPIQTAFGRVVGPVGSYIILVGTLFSMGGINMAEAFIAPRALHLFVGRRDAAGSAGQTDALGGPPMWPVSSLRC